MNNIVLAVLQGVVVMAVAPFFSGLGRVIRAKMHNLSLIHISEPTRRS